MSSTNLHLKIFILITVKYNLEAIAMIVYYLNDDMTVDMSMEFKFAFPKSM
jgi:hypothetical protein